MTPMLGIIASQMTGHLNTSSYESIQTVTVGSGGQASATFSSIPSTYKHLQIRGISRDNAGTTFDNQTSMRFNGDTGSNYSYHMLYGNGSGAGTLQGSSAGAIYTYMTPEGSTTGIYNGFIIDILDYANTSKNKVSRNLIGFDQNGNSASIGLCSGAWYSTSAITSITLAPTSSVWAQYSSFALYGVKG